MSDLANKTEKDLFKALSEKREALRSFRFGISGSKVRNIKEGRTIKKEIARILTVLSARNIK
ncbi:MAG: 50S ribosomal protein L29 [Candidatus Pacebacteria bacterium]|nr:50S ribosomal protein L29 [Candidatus Paceibacterota bacterium]